jgi:hypothetical protein
MKKKSFIYCLEGVQDIEQTNNTLTLKHLESLAINQGITSIYQSCDTIEGLEESLGNLLYDDHNFKNYKIIYLVMKGEENSVCLNNYFYSLNEIAEIFIGKLKGKIIHFANEKTLDLDEEEAQYFLDVTGALAISGYGETNRKLSSIHLDKLFFSLCEQMDAIVEIVEELHKKQYKICKLLDFRLYY